MDILVYTDFIWAEVRRHWISALLVLITLLTISILATVRWYFRRRWRLLLEERIDDEHELDFIPALSPKDYEAIQLIKRLRSQIWELPEVDLRLSVEALSEHAMRVIRSIAAVYHGQTAVPEYEASLVESLQLVRRVTARLIRLASLSPFRFLGEQKLSDYQRYYQVYRKINENPLLQMLKKHRRLYRVARWALDIKNLGNPLYWAGRELSKEGYFFMLRWFYLTFVSQVGKEAMRLYSGRHFQKEEDRDAALICYRLFALARRWGGPWPEDWSILINLVANQIPLEAETKLNVLSRCAQSRFPKNMEEHILQSASGRKWYQRGLKDLLNQQSPHTTARRSEIIREELERFEKEVASEAPLEKLELKRVGHDDI
jgi:hypothetical protein